MKTILVTCAMLIAGQAYAQQQFDSSQREAFRAALEACHSETGTTRPSQGSPPSEADRAKMQTCMTAKGYTMPDHPPRHVGGGHRRPASAESESQNFNGEGAGAIQ